MIQATSGGGSGGGFNPTQLSGLKLWLKADAGVSLDGSGNVSSWADQSGNGLNAVQTDAAKRPSITPGGIYGLPSLTFSGAQTLLGSGSLLTNGVTVFAVAKFNSATGRSSICNLGIQALNPSTQIFCVEQNTYSSVGRLGMYTSGNSYDSSLPSSTNQVRICIASDMNSGDSVPSTTVYRVNGVPHTLVSKSGGTLYTSDTKPGTSWLIGDIGLGFGYFSGKLSEIIVFNRKLTDSEIIQVEDYLNRYGLDPYISNTSLLLNMQGSPSSTVFTDESPNALAVTPYGNAQLVSDATFGTVASFDGTGDYLTIPSNAAFAFGTGDFTVEAWINTSNFGPDKFICSSSGSGGLFFGFDSSGRLGVGRAAIAWDNTVTHGMSAGTLNHVAVTRLAGSCRFFVNGTQVGSVFANTRDYNISTGSLNVGSQGTNYYFTGLIGPLRITKGVARYTSNFTPSLDLFPTDFYTNYTLPVSGAALWLDGADSSTLFTDAGVTPVTKSGDLIYQWSDKSGNNRHATQATSANRPTWVPPASGQNGFGAVGFNGTSQFLNTILQGQSSATVFAVVKKLSGKSQSSTTNPDFFDGIIDCDTAGQYGTGFGVNNTGGINAIYDNGFWRSVSTFDNSLATVFCYQWNNSELYFRKNMALSSSLSYTRGSVTTSNYVVGKSRANAFYFGGTVMELIFFTSYLSLIETQQIESYLKAKWGTP